MLYYRISGVWLGIPRYGFVRAYRQQQPATSTSAIYQLCVSCHQHTSETVTTPTSCRNRLPTWTASGLGMQLFVLQIGVSSNSTEMQLYSLAGMQLYSLAGMQLYTPTEMQLYNLSEMQLYNLAEMQLYNLAEMYTIQPC